ncbi:hypothetical protein KAR91_41580 [Candidatus Pacearchaeota archaeon]|nr:hypothetical protein [Candidatus Pacearchaeota archaeon]
MRENCKCQRATCGWEWISRIKGGPKSCPGCHSTQWRVKNKACQAKAADKVEMVCSICSDKLKEGQTIFRFQEGKNIKGIFVLESKESQGLYCENCSPPEDILPFAN